jgi:hypothetical protein
VYDAARGTLAAIVILLLIKLIGKDRRQWQHKVQRIEAINASVVYTIIP